MRRRDQNCRSQMLPHHYFLRVLCLNGWRGSFSVNYDRVLRHTQSSCMPLHNFRFVRSPTDLPTTNNEVSSNALLEQIRRIFNTLPLFIPTYNDDGIRGLDRVFRNNKMSPNRAQCKWVDQVQCDDSKKDRP